MERRWRDHLPKKKTTYVFLQWDFCHTCRRVQHYEFYKREWRELEEMLSVLNESPKPISQRVRKKQHQTRPKYENYINSKAWRTFREAYWKRHGKKCAGCEVTDGLTLHHVHYGYLGRERDEDVVPFCWDCHREFHDEYGTSTVMLEETNDFIAGKEFARIATTL